MTIKEELIILLSEKRIDSILCNINKKLHLELILSIKKETAEETRGGKNPPTTDEKKIEDLKRPCKLKSCLL